MSEKNDKNWLDDIKRNKDKYKVIGPYDKITDTNNINKSLSDDEINEKKSNIKKLIELMENTQISYIQIFDNVISEDLCDYFIDKQNYFENDIKSCYKCMIGHPKNTHLCMPPAHKGRFGLKMMDETHKDSIDFYLNDTAILESDEELSKNTKKVYDVLHYYNYFYLLNVGMLGIQYTGITINDKHLFEGEGREFPKSDRYSINSLNLRRYPADGGGYHIPHWDWTSALCYRVNALILYLNDVEEGGETAFPVLNESVKPKKGRLAIFPSYYTHVHYGKTASTDKYALVSHLVHKPFTEEMAKEINDKSKKKENEDG